MTADNDVHLLQAEVREQALSAGDGPWTSVYGDEAHEGGSVGVFSAFAPVAYRERALADCGWDLLQRDVAPGFMQSNSNDGRVTTTYLRYGNDKGIEPLVLTQTHFDLKEPMRPHISEEFRLFHNLWQSPSGDELVKVEDDGSESVVAIISHSEVKIRTPLLRRYQAARQLDLLLFVDSIRTSAAPYTASEIREYIVDDDHCLHFFVGEHSRRRTGFSRLVGKRILSPPPIEECRVWPYELHEDHGSFLSFIIGETDTGSAQLHSCDPDVLSDYFGGNPGAPHYLTPVFFRREVLQRYYEDSSKFDVEDGYLRCSGLWGVRIDNDIEDFVMVYLGDLGRDLPASHRDHWRAHNVSPTRGMSETNFRRSILSQFTDPSAPDLRFRSQYEKFNHVFEQAFGWPFYKKLHESDAHVLKRIRIPLNDSDSEFETQISGLAKLLVDSLNEKQLVQKLGGTTAGEKGISKFERWLSLAEYPHVERDVALLRKLQSLRSRGVAHRKSSDYRSFLEEEGVEPAALEIKKHLEAGLQMLSDLDAHFIEPDVDG